MSSSLNFCPLKLKLLFAQAADTGHTVGHDVEGDMQRSM